MMRASTELLLTSTPSLHNDYREALWQLWQERQRQFEKWGAPTEEAVGLAYIQCLHRLVLDRYPEIIQEMEAVMKDAFN